jgi:hypothetical protein
MSRKKKRPAQQRAVMRWEFDPSIPTEDFLEGSKLDRTWDLQEAVENFIYGLEEDRFLTWEAIVCEEQGLPLTETQKEAVGSLISFSDQADDQILYIDETPRPSQPWHVILNKIAPHLLVEPYRTFDVHNEEQTDGWHRIMEALDEHVEGLSLPPGASSYREVVPADLRHRLWLQYCFDMLGGLGQEDELTLANEEQQDRIGWFIHRLRECKESVAHFALNLESLLTRVILPERDRPIFVKLMQEKLGLTSAPEPIANRL